MKLPGDEKPEDVKAKRRFDNPSWQRQVNSVNAKGQRIYKTAAENAEATFTILNDDMYSKDEKLQGVYAFLGKALQPQQRGQTRSGRLFENSSMCRTATAAPVAAAPKPSKPGDSGNSKGKDDDPKKDKKHPHGRDEASRTGSHHLAAVLTMKLEESTWKTELRIKA